MAFSHTPVSLEAITRAKDLARLIGGEKFLEDQASKISDGLLALEHLPEKIVRHEKGIEAYQYVRRVETPVTYRRPKASKAKLDALRKTHPRAYERAVRTSAPEKPYTVRMDCQTRGASTEWAALREESAAIWRGRLEQRFAHTPSNAQGAAHILFELRQLHRDAEIATVKAKDELAKFVVDNDLPLIIPSWGDGKLVLRPKPLSVTVDYELLEREFPAALSLFPKAEYASSVSLRFAQWVPTPEDPDDSDDSAFGMGYRQRRGLA